MLPRDERHGITDAQVPKSTRPAPDPTNHRNFRIRKNLEEEKRQERKWN